MFHKVYSKEMHYFYRFSYHPLINPKVNPTADILPVIGIPKLVIARDAAACSLVLPIDGTYVLIFESVVISSSDIC